MKKTVLKIFAVIICLSVVAAMPAASSAASVDTTATADLTIILTPDGVAVPGADFKLYRIADISKSGNFTLTPPFSNFPVVFKTHDADSLRKLALTLKGYVITQKIEPDYTGVTDSSGRAYFNDIPLGMYLVVGSSVTIGNTTYVPETFIITLPAEAENGSWEYDVNVRTKTLVGMAGAMADLRVLKVWDDSGDSSARPNEITVELYLGNVLYDTVVLSKENNWHYTWSRLAGLDWTVVEKEVPDGYKVSVERDGNSFVITNSRENEETTKPDSTDPNYTNPDYSSPDYTDPDYTNPDLTTPDGTENGSSHSSAATGAEGGDGAGSGNGSSGSGGGGGEASLPQTGMLWWPVPVLAFAGIAVFMLGWRINRRNEDES